MEKKLIYLALIISFLKILKFLNFDIFNINLIYFDFLLIILFLINYMYNLLKSKDRRKYFKENKYSIFKVIPITRFIIFLKRIFRNFLKFIKLNNFIYTIYLSIFFIILGSISFYFFEKENVKNIFDAIWWAFVTITTVGYGDIVPKTLFGKISSVVLMMVGIGTIGMLTSTLSTYFIKEKIDDVNDDSIEKINNAIDLTFEDKKKVISYIKFLKSQRKE